MTKNALAILGCAASVATAFAGASCSTTTACAVDGSGNYICDSYVGAYPYDYVYYDPYYTTTWGYYPYYVDTYYDPYGYSYVYQASTAPVPTADASTGSNVPELLDKAHRAANAIDVGVRAALDPIKELIKTQPTQNGDTVVYGPANVGGGNYQFTMRRVSEAEKRFGWKLEARAASSSGSFSQVAGGTIRVGDQPRRGHGVFGVNCDAMSAADTMVTCRGTLLMGFAHTNDGDKILKVGLKAYTPDTSASMPLDAEVFAWRHGDSANHVRLVAQTNLAGTSSTAQETVAMKLTYIKDVGVRVDAAATGGDVAQGQMTVVSTCVPPDLDQSHASTSTHMCNADGSGCTGTALSCPAQLDTAEIPNPDAMASDPPANMPEMPTEPTSMPDGSGN
jgi:hypothetical protein